MPINMSVEFPKLEAENQKLKRLLHDLTPGGSKFYNEPEKCAAWIKENRGSTHYTMAAVIKDLKKIYSESQADNERLREALLPLVNLSDAVFIDTRKDKEGILYAFNAAEITYNDLRAAKAALQNK